MDSFDDGEHAADGHPAPILNTSITMAAKSTLASISAPSSVLTAFDSGARFPEAIAELRGRYEPHVEKFAELIAKSATSGELLERIRGCDISADDRMPLLKLFRRCVSGVCDTEMTKKVKAVTTKSLVDAYGHTFKPIELLKKQFGNLSDADTAALAVALGEYDTRGQQGYALTEQFFSWFEATFGTAMSIAGPRGAGPDVELSSVAEGFTESCPCDFVITDKQSGALLAVGFARYDSTRGGAQSDDRTGGNANKVDKIRRHCERSATRIRVLFLADGPGLAHGDTWKEACDLDGSWNDNVRVTTLKLAAGRVTPDWLRGR